VAAQHAGEQGGDLHIHLADGLTLKRRRDHLCRAQVVRRENGGGIFEIRKEFREVRTGLVYRGQGLNDNSLVEIG